MRRAIAVLTLAALAAAAGCKSEDKKKEKPRKAAAARVEATPKPEPRPKLDTPEKKLAFVRRCARSLGDEALEDCYAEDAELTHFDRLWGPATIKGRASIASPRRWRPLLKAVPDARSTPILLLQNGDEVASIVLVSGTDTGPLSTPRGELPATGKEVGWYTFHLQTLDPAAGGVAAEIVVNDMSTFLGQLGVAFAHRPAPDPPEGEPIAVSAGGDQTERDNLAAYDAAIEAFNAHDAKALAQSFAPEIEVIDLSRPKDPAPAELTRELAHLFKSFPDIKWDPFEKWAAGDYVVAVAEITGTREDGVSIDVTGAQVVRLEGGKATRAWFFMSSAAVTKQLKQRPTPRDSGGRP